MRTSVVVSPREFSAMRELSGYTLKRLEAECGVTAARLCHFEQEIGSLRQEQIARATAAMRREIRRRLPLMNAVLRQSPETAAGD
jgi:hypothetical protein